MEVGIANSLDEGTTLLHETWPALACVLVLNIFLALAILQSTDAPRIIWKAAAGQGVGFSGSAQERRLAALAEGALAKAWLKRHSGLVAAYLLGSLVLGVACIGGLLGAWSRRLRGDPPGDGLFLAGARELFLPLLGGIFLLGVGLVFLGIGAALAAAPLVRGGLGVRGLLLILWEMFLFVALLIWLKIKLCFWSSAAALERRGLFSCFSASVHVAEGHGWGILGIIVLPVLIWRVCFLVLRLTLPADMPGRDTIMICLFQIGTTYAAYLVSASLLAYYSRSRERAEAPLGWGSGAVAAVLLGLIAATYGYGRSRPQLPSASLPAPTAPASVPLEGPAGAPGASAAPR